MKMRSWSWDDPMYGVKLQLLHGGGGDDFKRWIQRHAKCEAYTDDELRDAKPNKAAVCLYRPEDDAEAHVALWFSHATKPATNYGISTIAHESVHAAMAVFRDRQMPVTQDSEEPFAYYHTYLVMQIMKRLRP